MIARLAALALVAAFTQAAVASPMDDKCFIKAYQTSYGERYVVFFNVSQIRSISVQENYRHLTVSLGQGVSHTFNGEPQVLSELFRDIQNRMRSCGSTFQ